MARQRIPAPGLALAAALALAGCRVEVDGAPCASPQATGDCPDGQACGNDLRCSARALACAPSRCAPGAKRCTGAVAFRCTAADPVCGRWEADDCGARGMECGTQGSEACECPAYAGTTIVADPSVPSLRGAAPFPTGQEEPPECRFGRLGDALAAAGALAPAAATVRIAAQGAGPAVFGAATGEEWPLLVTSGVLLAGATPAGAAVVRGAPGVPAILVVEGAIEDVRVDAEDATTAVRVAAAGARLARLDVSGAAGAALQIQVDPASPSTVEVVGGRYGASRVGIWIRSGKVSVAPDPLHASSAVASENPGSTVVAGNDRDGVVIGGAPERGLPGLPSALAQVSAALERASVEANGGAGIILGQLFAPTRVRVSGCDVHGNGAAAPVAYGSVGRKAGGVLVALAAGPQLSFTGNRLWSNARDQLAVESGTWSIAPPACGTDSNVFACVTQVTPGCDDDDGCAVALSESGSVSAENNVWPCTPPYPYVTPVDGRVAYFQDCNGRAGVPPAPVCEPAVVCE